MEFVLIGLPLLIVPAVLIVVAVCDSMHVINSFAKAARHASPVEKIQYIYKDITLPCLLTSLTTAVGFISLYTLKANIIRQFGLFISFGAVVAFLFSFTLLPLLLNIFFSKHNFQSSDLSFLFRRIRAALEKSKLYVFSYKKHIQVISVMVLLLSVLGITMIRVDMDVIDAFRNDSLGLVESNEFVKNNHVGASAESFGYFKATKLGDDFYNPENLKKIDKVSLRILSENPALTKVLSVVELIKSFHQALHDNDPNFYRIPDTRQEVRQIVLMMESINHEFFNLRQFVTPDFSEIRI